MSAWQIGDLIGGLSLAAFLAIPFGMIANLFISLSESPPPYNAEEPVITQRDIRRTLLIAIVFIVAASIPFSFLFAADRKMLESWQVYARDHKCVVVDQRTHTEMRGGGYPGTSHGETITEYLWRCEGGDEHWRR